MITRLWRTDVAPNRTATASHGQEIASRAVCSAKTGDVDMCCTCDDVLPMVMIQIRNVPSPLHLEMKARAARAGMSLSDYLLREVHHLAERPTLEQMRERLAKLPRIDVTESPADAVRAERDSR